MAEPFDRMRGDRLLPGWFLFIDSDPQVRVWSGNGPYTLGATGPDATGGTYKGMGILTGVPELRLPVNGAAAQHVFTLSGVDANAVRLVEADRATLRNAKVAIARAELNLDGTILSAPLWLWQGWCETPRMARNGSSLPVTYTVSLIVSSGAVRRKARRLSFYTGPQQRERDGADTSCDSTAQYAAGSTVIWPGSA